MLQFPILPSHSGQPVWWSLRQTGAVSMVTKPSGALASWHTFPSSPDLTSSKCSVFTPLISWWQEKGSYTALFEMTVHPICDLEMPSAVRAMGISWWSFSMPQNRPKLYAQGGRCDFSHLSLWPPHEYIFFQKHFYWLIGIHLHR